MGSSLNDSSMFQNHNTVRISYRRKSMCNDERRSSMHQAIHTVLHNLLCSGINGTGRFIQNQNRRICNRCPCDGRSADAAPGSSCHRLLSATVSYPFGSLRDKSICIGQFCCRERLLHPLHPAFHNRIFSFTVPVNKWVSCNTIPRERRRSGLLDLVNIDSVIADLSVLNIIKSVDQIGNGRLSGSGGSHKGNLLPRLCIQVQYHGARSSHRVISKIYIIKDHIPFQLRYNLTLSSA